MKKNIFLLGALSLAFLNGCVDGAYLDNNRAAIGGVLGAVAGGVIGHQIDDDSGRYVGAVAGALAGAGIGYYMDQQQRQIQQQMQGTGVSVERVDEGTLQLNVAGDVLFAHDDAQISSGFYQPLAQLAQTLNQYPQTAVHVYGYTDSTGSAQYNQGLSERRASAVADYLRRQGVNAQRLVVRGYGENYPRASNDSSYGRAQNRRVEIFIRAIGENNPQAAYQQIYR